MVLAKRRKATLLVAKLDRLSRSVALIATLMDSRGFDLAIADMPRANRLTLHVLAAAAEHERHMIGERTRHALAAAKARGVKLGSKQAEINRAKAAEQAQALRPHITAAIDRGRMSSNAIAARRIRALQVRAEGRSDRASVTLQSSCQSPSAAIPHPTRRPHAA
jgi:DNA invertase Pin-like site-specific DNA recombinase